MGRYAQFGEKGFEKAYLPVAEALYIDEPIDPVSLDGVDHVDVDLSGKRIVIPQVDLLTNPTYRVYFRIDNEAAAGGTTIALFKPMGFLAKGGCEPEGLWLDPDAEEGPYLHLLLTDSTGTAQVGGADDWTYLLPKTQGG